MKNAFLSLALAATIALAGCAGFFVSQNPCTGTSCGGGTSTTSGFFYVLNGTTQQIVGFQVASDKLTTLTGGTLSLSGVNPLCMAISPNKNYLYVGTISGIYYYTINSSTGALTVGNNGSIISGIIPQSMQVDATNGWLVIAPVNTAQLAAIQLDTSTGNITNGNPQAVNITAASTKQLVISPDNNHVFVTLGISGTDAILFNAASADPFGTDTNNPVSNPAGSGAALTIAVDPKSQFVFIGETSAITTAGVNNTGGLRVLAITSTTSNTLTEQTGSPYPSGGIGPADILVDSTDSFVYVANQTVYGQATNNIGNVTGYGTTISTTAGVTTETLTALTNSPYSAGTNTIALAEDNSDSFIIALNAGGSPDMNIYSFSTTNPGALSLTISTASGATDPTGAFSVVAVP